MGFYPFNKTTLYHRNFAKQIARIFPLDFAPHQFSKDKSRKNYAICNLWDFIRVYMVHFFFRTITYT